MPAAVAAIHLTGTLHPPGGATACVAAAGGGPVHTCGYWCALSPCALGSVLLVAFGLIFNNIPAKQQYSQFWQPPPGGCANKSNTAPLPLPVRNGKAVCCAAPVALREF